MLLLSQLITNFHDLSTPAMWIGILFISFLFQITTAALGPHFLVILPQVIPADGSTKACIHLTNLNESLSLTCTLQTNTDNITLINEVIRDTDWHRCISFQDSILYIAAADEVKLNVTGKGDTYQFEKIKKIHLDKRQKSSIFLQTDKPLYKPGQTAKFRIVSMNEHFMPDLAQIPLVTVQDPNRNRIAQWLNVTTQNGIGDLSIPLASEPIQGQYKIEVQGAKSITEHSFTVEEYVLPKHDVQLKLPPAVNVMDKEFTVTMCAKYTYGKPVQGTVHMSICRRSHYMWYNKATKEMESQYCNEFDGTTDTSGCFSKVIDAVYFHLRTPAFEMSFVVKAILTEDDTNQQFTVSGNIPISTLLAQLEFKDTPKNYKAGLSFRGKVFVKDTSNSPLAGVNVIIKHSGSNYFEILPTDVGGQAYFSLNTSAWNDESITLSASLENIPHTRQWSHKVNVLYAETAELTVRPLYSKSMSYLQIQSASTSKVECDVDFYINVDYVFSPEALEGHPGTLVFFYLIMQGRRVVLEGQKKSNINTGTSERLKGKFSIKVSLGADVAPKADVLVYGILPNGELIADSREFMVSKCFRNKVNLHFLEPQVSPGSETSLHLKAAADSLCSLRVVDQSVFLLKPEEDLSADKVYSTAKQTTESSHVSEEDPPPCLTFDLEGYDNVTYNLTPASKNSELDVYRITLDMGLYILTDTSIRKPVYCFGYVTMYLNGSVIERLFVNVPDFVVNGPDFVNGPGFVNGPDFVNGPYFVNGPDFGFGINYMNIANGINYLNIERESPKSKPQQETPEKVRKYFPETWIWDLVSVGSSGNVDVPVTVPDTITEWKAGMFCMANSGFGLAETVELNAFKPFFVEPVLPYSVIQGEEFPLKVTVFNYLQQCIKVQVTLENSEDFKTLDCERCEYSSCICGGKTKTFFWSIIPVSIGEVNFTITAEAVQTNELCDNEIVIVPTRNRKDTVIKPLRVEPEGTKVEMAKSFFLCPNGSTLLENISVQLPQEVVKGSTSAHISVFGDIMGTALQNLDNLLAMPYGCGEQNMLQFAPNIFILQYLEKTGQLTPAIKEKSIHFLKSGYQRELMFKHPDGSYSAFGNSDSVGSTWLTAFVLKSFGQATPYIFIDDHHMQQAINWLRNVQLQNGCFQSVGKLLHSSMKGGVNDDISLSAYIVAALLEIPKYAPKNTISQGLFFLDTAVQSVTNPYTLALMAYTYALAGRMMTRNHLLRHLHSTAIDKDGMLHWKYWNHAKNGENIDDPYIWYQAPSSEVEMAAYVLLALMSVPNPSSNDITSAAKIVKWITKQQGPYGGFDSTQDTVVALQALSKYSGWTYNNKGHVTVSIKSKKNLVEKFEVNKDNRLLLQRAALTDIPGNYTAEISGDGCIILQTTLKYNIPPPVKVSAFAIQVETDPSNCTSLLVVNFNVIITVSYTGERNVSNMAIIEVKMLSGYIPDKKSVKKLQSDNPVVQRTEVKTHEVIIYLEELSHETKKFVFHVEEEIPVKNLKPAMVKIYDYYNERADNAVTQYTAPCSKKAET